MAYDIGDQVRITTTFTNLAGAVADPTVITCVVKSPLGTSTTYTYGTDAELTRTSTGIYNLDLSIVDAGTYKYKFAGIGALVTADQGRVEVRRSLA
jgi:hypothetical protein